MPIIKSAIKRARQALKRRSRNLHVKREVHRDMRAVMAAAATGDTEATAKAMREAQSEIDRAVKKGTLHKNTAARRKSRLVSSSAKVLTAAQAPKPEAKPRAKKADKPAAKKAAKSK